MSTRLAERAFDAVDRTIIQMAQESIDRAQDGKSDAPSDEGGSLDGVEDLVHLSPSVYADASITKPQGTLPPDESCECLGQLGRYRIIRVLGHGSFGVVLLAYDPRLQREVALKLPRPELLAMRGWRRRLLHEARSAALLDHPNIVPIYEIGKLGPVWYIASAHCNGPTLRQWCREQAPVSARTAAELVALIADAVQHAHNRGLLHRDLKPANVLLKLSPQEAESTVPTPQVTDFGLAVRRRSRGKRLRASGRAGTLAYMAPEQTRDDPSRVGTAVDVYALGAILFELLVGRPPFVAQDERKLVAQIRNAPPPSFRNLRPEVSPDLAAICAKCLAKSPVDRYDSAASLARDLRRFLAGYCVEARPANLPRRTWRWCRRRPALAALSAALIFAVACGGVISLRQWQRAEMNLRQAETAVVDLGWAIDDAAFWHHESDDYGPRQRAELTRRYAALLQQLGSHPAARPVHAAADCFYARLDALDGRPELAREKFTRSIAAWQKLVASERNNTFHRRALAKTLYAYGAFLVTADAMPDGLEHFDDLRLLGLVDSTNRTGRTIVSDYATLLFEKAEALRAKDLDVEAAAHYGSCIGVSRRLLAMEPNDAKARFRIVQSQVRLVAVHRPAASREDQHRTRVEALLELRSLVREFPDRADFRLEHARVARWLGTRRSTYVQDLAGHDLIAEAKASLEAALAADSCPPQARTDYADTLRIIAHRNLDSGDLKAAMQTARESLRWYDVAERDGGFAALPHADACRKLGGIFLACEADQDAIAAFERAGGLYNSARLDAPRNRGVHLQHADVWYKLSILYQRTGRTAEALTAAQASVTTIEAWRGPAPSEPHVARQLLRLRSNAERLAEL